MRKGIGYYRSKRSIKDKLHKEKDKLCYDIFDYLSDFAAWKVITEEVQEVKIELIKGQLITSLQMIEDYLASWGTKAGNTAIRNKLKKLEKIGAITSEELKKGSKSIGKKITVIHLTAAYEEEEKNKANEADNTHPALEPPAFEQIGNTYNEENNTQSNTYNNTHDNTHPALEPQGIGDISNTYNNTQSNTYNNTPFLKEVKEVKEKELKHREREEAASILSVATAVQKNHVSRITDIAEKALGNEFSIFFLEDLLEHVTDLGFEEEVIIRVLIKASKNAKYVKTTVNRDLKELRQKGIKTLLEYEQYATLKETETETSQPRKRTGTEGNNRRTSFTTEADTARYNNIF